MVKIAEKSHRPIEADLGVALSRSPCPLARVDGQRANILLFGAYGNGNIGDAMQAATIERAIRSLRSDISVWATYDQYLDGRFEFNYAKVLPPDTIARIEDLKVFDHIIIGGGGLLAHPHDPLFDPKWQAELNVSYSLLSIGASFTVANLSRTLVQNARFVSGRDASSLEALRSIRSDVVYSPDPVLADPTLCLDVRRSARRDRKSVLWILKYSDIGSYDNILMQIDHDLDTICFLEPALDCRLLLRWPNAQCVYSAERLVELVDGSDLVVTMRYHGAIVAFQRGVPCYGLREQKTRELLSAYGLQNHFSDHGHDFSREKMYVSARRSYLRRDRKIFIDLLSDILCTLPEAGPEVLS